MTAKAAGCDPGVHRLWRNWKKLEAKGEELIDRSKNHFYTEANYWSFDCYDRSDAQLDFL